MAARTMQTTSSTMAANIHRLPVEAALAALGSSLAGLSSLEASRRLARDGPNRIEQKTGLPMTIRLAGEFFRFFSVILWIAAALAFIADQISPEQGMARIGYALITVIIVSGVFSFWQEYRVEQTLRALQGLLPRQATLLRDGKLMRLPVEQLVAGDMILFEQGDLVSADCRIIEAFGLCANVATITGEAMQQPRDAAVSQSTELLRSRNVLLAGTSIVSGHGRAVAFATGARTEFGRIAELSQSSQAPTSPLRRQLAFLSRLIAALAIGMGLLFFAVGAVIGVPIWQDFIFAIGLIVAMVPEGLLPTLTLSLALAAQRLARRNVLIRNLASVETLGSATVICTDKTGTLTQNRMCAEQLLLGRNSHAASTVLHDPKLVQRFQQFFTAAYRCHDLRETNHGGRRVLLGDPTEAALVEMAESAAAENPAAKRLGEIPFDSERMRHSVVCETADGAVLYCKGAPERVLPLCPFLFDGDKVVALDVATRAAIVAAQEGMAERGLRSLALATKHLSSDEVATPAEADLVFLGLVGLQDPPRPEVPRAVRTCTEAGIKVVMVTGDHPHTALAVARQIGLVRSSGPVIVSGEDLSHKSDDDLAAALAAPEVIFARVAPDQKMRIVEALRRSGHVVATTGDGVNDAPALKAAHIGIAMGVSGTDVAKAAADMILLDDNFASIVLAIEEGRAVFQNIRKFLTYVLVHNVAELVPYIAFALFRIPLPLTPLQALAVDMGTDSLTALGLGVEPASPEAMRLPPRSQRTRLMNLALAMRAYLFLGVIEAAAGIVAFLFVLKGAGWNNGQQLAVDDLSYRAGTTACLSAIIVMQIVNVFLCRSSVRSAFDRNVFNNKLILCGVVLEILLLFVFDFSPWGHFLLATAVPPPGLWLLLLPFAAAMLAFEEMRKWVVRRRLRHADMRRFLRSTRATPQGSATRPHDAPSPNCISINQCPDHPRVV